MMLSELKPCVLCGRTLTTKTKFDVGVMCDDSNGCRRTAVKQQELEAQLPQKPLTVEEFALAFGCLATTVRELLPAEWEKFCFLVGQTMAKETEE